MMSRRFTEPVYRENRTHALAKGALFFAFLAFLISCVTLLLCWHDGGLSGGRMKGLMKGLTDSAGAIRAKVHKLHPARGGGEPKEEEGGGPLSGAKLHERLTQVEAMVRRGDSQARGELDRLKADLERWRSSPEAKTPLWLSQAIQSLEAARQKLAVDAPQAASRLRELAAQLQNKIPRFETAPIPHDARATPAAAPSAKPEANPDE